MLVGCSSTSAVPDGDQLYTGMRSTRYEDYKPCDHFTAVQEEVEMALAAEPNGAIFGSPYYKTPFPYRLWIYNAFHKSQSPVSRWITKTFGKAPVLMSGVNPGLRSQVATELLRSRGYFSAYVNYDTFQQSNPKKAKIGYTVNLGELHLVDTLVYSNFPPKALALIDSTRDEAIVRGGVPFDVSTLEAERTRVANVLRNNGFIYYQPAYATYLADTIAKAGMAQVRLQMADSLPARVSKQWYIGRINLELRHTAMQQLTDTVVRRNYTVIYSGKRQPIRRSAITRDMKLRPKQLYSYENYQHTLNTLTSKGLFSRVDLTFQPRDTTAACDTLDMTLNCVFDKPYDFYIETNMVGKTTGRVGPELVMGLTKRNAFRGGEKLSIDLKGSYEWQTGHKADGTSSEINSYEYGIDVSLEMPRLLFLPNKTRRKTVGGTVIRKRFYATPNTLLKASRSTLSRSGFFKRNIVSGELTYTIQPSATVMHQFSPLILQYEYMKSRTDAFLEVLEKSPYLMVSMADQFVPKMRYTLTRQSAPGSPDPLYWTVSVSEASNILSLGYLAFGKKWGEKGKTLFKNPYAQFFKIETDIRKTWTLSGKNTLVAHAGGGIVWSYGNAQSSPYSEQFYVGGANSIRAFNVRSIGPGTYHTDKSGLSYMDQTGDIKLQFNLEYRPHLFGSLYGALFLDAGNVWAMRDDGYRAGGKLHLKNLLKEMALGTGVGLRYDLDFFVLRLDWGVGLHLPYRSGFYNMPTFKDSHSLHFAIGYPF